MTVIAQARPFISYAREDLHFAEKLLSDLQFAGAEPWLDVEHLLGGQDWEREVRHALRDATHVIALLSERAVNKRGFIQKELRYALDQLQEFPPGDIFLVPVRLDETIPRHDELQKIQWIDFFPSYYEGYHRLAQSLGLVIPPLQYLTVNTHYTLENSSGELASVRNIQVLQAHIEGVSALLTRGIAGTGHVDKIKSNLGSVEVETEGGIVSAITHLEEPLPLRRPVEHVLSYDGINCFNSSSETVAQNIAHPVHESGIHVRFPKTRLSQKVTGYIAYGETTNYSPHIDISPDKLSASLAVRYPSVGARMVLKWDW